MSILGYQQFKKSAQMGVQGLDKHPVGQHTCTCPPSSLMGGSLAWDQFLSQQPLTASQLQRDWMMVWIAWMHSLLQRRQVSCSLPFCSLLNDSQEILTANGSCPLTQHAVYASQ